MPRFASRTRVIRETVSSIARKYVAPAEEERRDGFGGAPPGFLEILATSPTNLRWWGISEAAANKWLECLVRAEIPKVDAGNKPREFQSLEEFFDYVRPFVEVRSGNKEAGS